MEEIEELLAEEVRKYEHVYNPSLKEYKDTPMAINSWREISLNVGMRAEDCTKMWRKLRDRFVRARKFMRSSSGDAGGKKVPAFYLFLSWLGPHIKHRATSSKINKQTNDFHAERRSSSNCRCSTYCSGGESLCNTRNP